MIEYLGSLPGAVAQGLIWGLMAIGVYITFKILDIADLTVDGSFCTGGAVTAVLVTNGVSVWIAILCGFLAGAAAGFLTGVFHTAVGIPPILAGILTQQILWSVNLKIMGKANITVSSRTFRVILAQMDIPRAIVVLLGFSAVTVALLYWFFGTELGCSIRSTGCNEQMSRAQGINTGFNKVLGLAISNGFVALAGALLTQYQGFADLNMGKGAIVIGLAAIVIGEAVMSHFAVGMIPRLIGVLCGGILYFLIYQTVIFIGLDADLLKMLSALIVAAMLGVPYIRKTYFGRTGTDAKEAKKGGKADA